MGAHVWGPAYLRDHLLPHGRLTGWTPDWYAGFPALPVLHGAPGAADRAARRRPALRHRVQARHGARASWPAAVRLRDRPAVPPAVPRPAPARGGHACRSCSTAPSRSTAATSPSTLAGEFSFSISLSLALLFLGVLARGLTTGRAPGAGGGAAGAGVLCHAIPAFFAMRRRRSVLVLLRLRSSRGSVFAAPTLRRRRAAHRVLVAPVRAPARGYLNDMGWEKLARSTRTTLLPDSASAGCCVLALVRRRAVAASFWIRMGAFFGRRGRSCRALGFVLRRRRRRPLERPPPALLLPVASTCWRPSGVSEVLRSLAVIVDARIEWRRRLAEGVGAVVVAGRGIVLVAPAAARRCRAGDTLGGDGVVPLAGPADAATTSFVDSWAQWNYSGYERKAAYPEYRTIVTTMAERRRRARLRPGPLGVRERPQPLRHADGADAPAVLDRRLHRLDGGPVLRGARPPRRSTSSTRRRSRRRRRTRCATCPSGRCPTPASTSTRACATSS